MAAEARKFIVHPHKFGMWIFILTSIMVFAGFTSAYIVSRSLVKAENLLYFKLPSIMVYNTLAIALSSAFVWWGTNAAKQGDRQKVILALLGALVLGAIFTVGQWQSFKEMVSMGLPLVNKMRRDQSVSFFYVLTGLHAVHVIAALVVLIVGIFRAKYKTFKEKNGLHTMMEVVGTFWHFLGLLWVYLYLFLLYTQRNI